MPFEVRRLRACATGATATSPVRFTPSASLQLPRSMGCDGQRRKMALTVAALVAGARPHVRL